MNPILIKQPIGLGDILFLQKAAHMIRRKHPSNHIIWPVTKQYADIGQHLLYFDFPCVDDDFEFKKEYLECPKATIRDNIICTDGASIDGCGVMTSKYKMLDIDHSDWWKYCAFERNEENENRLFSDILGLTEDDQYIVWNESIGSAGYESTWNIPVPTDKKAIKIEVYDGISVFDWCKVFERASEFHLMETCFCYLIEKLLTRETDYKLYHRSPSDSLNFKEFGEIYQKPKIHVGSEQISRK